MEELTVEILDALEKYWDEDTKILQSKILCYGDVILALLISEEMERAAKILGTSHSTLDKKLPKTFKRIQLGVRWSANLALVVNKRKCSRCFNYKTLDNFGVASSNNIGKRYECMECCKTVHKYYHIIHKELRNKQCREYHKRKPYLSLARNAKRRAKLIQAATSWSDFEAIAEFYRLRPVGYHVDHIIPLQHDLVCGLHVINNLQYLTAEENLQKTNHFIID